MSIEQIRPQNNCREWTDSARTVTTSLFHRKHQVLTPDICTKHIII